MAVLQPSEYDASYFDGRSQPLRHNAGYSYYKRWNRHEGENSKGEYWLDYASNLVNVHNLSNKKTLEIACAKGFVVESLRGMGVDAYGIDISAYAIGEATPEVAPFLTVADVRTYLTNYNNNEFDAVYSLRYMECVDDVDIPALISEMNRISKYQFHVIDEQPLPSFYNVKTLDDWLLYDWTQNKTVLVSNETKRELRK